MSVDVPVSTWRRTSGNGELATTSGNLVTLSGSQLITLSGLNLVILGGSYTAVPATAWATVETAPVSLWRPTDGHSDFSNDGVAFIVDPSRNFLVDTIRNNIVDTGVVESEIPATDWIEDDSL